MSRNVNLTEVEPREAKFAAAVFRLAILSVTVSPLALLQETYAQGEWKSVVDAAVSRVKSIQVYDVTLQQESWKVNEEGDRLTPAAVTATARDVRTERSLRIVSRDADQNVTADFWGSEIEMLPGQSLAAHTAIAYEDILDPTVWNLRATEILTQLTEPAVADDGSEVKIATLLPASETAGTKTRQRGVEFTIDPARGAALTRIVTFWATGDSRESALDIEISNRRFKNGVWVPVEAQSRAGIPVSDGAYVVINNKVLVEKSKWLAAGDAIDEPPMPSAKTLSDYAVGRVSLPGGVDGWSRTRARFQSTPLPNDVRTVLEPDRDAESGGSTGGWWVGGVGLALLLVAVGIKYMRSGR